MLTMIERFVFGICFVLYIVVLVAFSFAFIRHVSKKIRERHFGDAILLVVIMLLFLVAFGGILLWFGLALAGAADIPFLPYWLVG